MLQSSKVSNFFNQLPDHKTKSYIDLHIHTRASDGFIETDFLKDFLKDTPHLISITDHNEISSSLKLYSTKGVNVIPGIEVGCKDGFEFLVYFNNPEDLTEFYFNSVKPYKTKHEIARTEQDYNHFLVEARKYDSFVSIPHISGIAHKNYLRKKDYIKNAINRSDGIETYNHSLTKRRNKTACRVRKNNNKFATFGSDAHLKQGIKSFYKFQNSRFSSFAYAKNNLYNMLSVVALFGKHLSALLEIN